MKAYLQFFTSEPQDALKIAKKYHDYPVQRWQNMFREVEEQIREMEGEGLAQVLDQESRAQKQEKLASTEPNLEFSIEGKKIILHYQNLSKCFLSFYAMDIGNYFRFRFRFEFFFF
jgi:hypothetical protein